MGKRSKWPGGYRTKGGVFIIRRTINERDWEVSTRCKTRDGAMRELARWESDPHNYVPSAGEEPSRVGYAEAVARYLEVSKKVRGNSDKHLVSQGATFDVFRTYLSARGVDTLTGITQALVEGFIAWRRDGNPFKRHVGPHAIALDVVIVKGLTKWASMSGGLTDVDPLAKMPTPKRPRYTTKPRIIPEDGRAWEKVRPHLLRHWQLAGDILLGSSMRYSSLARLRPQDVDTEKDTLWLAGNLIKGRNGLTIKVSHKVALAAKALTTFQRETYSAVTKTHRMVTGLPSNPSDFNHAIAHACAKAGVPVFTVHMFRHTAASWMIADGLSVKDAQERLAHASVTTTQIYIHRLMGKGDYKGRV